MKIRRILKVIVLQAAGILILISACQDEEQIEGMYGHRKVMRWSGDHEAVRVIVE
jgi:hypothetical protein